MEDAVLWLTAAALQVVPGAPVGMDSQEMDTTAQVIHRQADCFMMI